MSAEKQFEDLGPAELVTQFLGVFTLCEGIVEDLGYVYLQSVPEEIVKVLVARRPWSSEASAALLASILAREPIASSTVPNLFKRVGPTRSYDFVGEWRWATRVRNDLAHSAGGQIPGGWSLTARASRYELRELAPVLSTARLSALVQRLFELQGGLIELACYLGLRDYGWEGPGPAPFESDGPVRRGLP